MPDEPYVPKGVHPDDVTTNPEIAPCKCGNENAFTIRRRSRKDDLPGLFIICVKCGDARDAF